MGYEDNIAIDAILPFLLIFFGILLIVSIITVIAQWRLFKKAGEEGWKSIIPIYNTYTMIKIAFGRGKEWLMTGLFFSILSLAIGTETSIGLILALIGSIFSIYISFQFIKRYTGTGMAVASLFFPVIIYPIVAFSDRYQYTSPK